MAATRRVTRPVRRARSSTLLGAVVVGTVLTAAPAAASGTLPAPGQPLGISPAAGNDSVVPTLTTAAPCPAEASHVYVVLHGGALPEEGQVVRDTTRQGLSTTAAFTVEGSRTWRDTFLAAGALPAAGEHLVELVCTNELGSKLARFTTPLTFSSPTSYAAADGPQPTAATIAAGRPADGAGTGDLAVADPAQTQEVAEALGAGAAAGSTRGSTPGGTVPGTAGAAPADAASVDPAATAGTAGTAAGTGTLVGVGVLGAVLAAGLLLVAGALRRRRSGPPDAPRPQLTAVPEAGR